MAQKDKLSIFLCYILRHNPDAAGITWMNKHGWVKTKELIDGVNVTEKYKLNMKLLQEIVANDEKGRYRLSEDLTLIKACQGHSIKGIEPEMELKEPPEFLYHGTKQESLNKIRREGRISKMSRHAVHMQAAEENAWKSALRWHSKPVVLKIDAKKMHEDGFVFGETDNHVWCTDEVPFSYVCDVLYVKM